MSKRPEFFPRVVVGYTVPKIMLHVLAALLPGIAAMVWIFGIGVLVNCMIAILSAEISEAAILLLRKKPLQPALGDFSAVLSAVLLALCLPPLTPWWITVVGTLFAIAIGKHLYGGLGYNPFNPAMVGYIAVLLSFPKQMTAWIAPTDLLAIPISLSDTLKLILLEAKPPHISFDAITMATPLDAVRTGLTLSKPVNEIVAGKQFGVFSGVGWDWIAGGFLLGGLWLIQRRIIDWRIPCSLLLMLFSVSALFFIWDPQRYPSPLFHLFAGGSMLGAFFIATDPVTAATTPIGRLIFGACAGLLVFIIRSWGGYPEGLAFSILLMNLAAPTIDNYSRPKSGE